MNRNRKKTELTRERIMDVARELLVEKGYVNVSMRQIANELNCSHGAIYYHFKNKAELFYALVEDHFLMLEEKMNRTIKEPIEKEEKLRKLLLGFIQDRKSTRLNSSHVAISYAVFCLKKKKQT